MIILKLAATNLYRSSQDLLRWRNMLYMMSVHSM